MSDNKKYAFSNQYYDMNMPYGYEYYYQQPMYPMQPTPTYPQPGQEPAMPTYPQPIQQPTTPTYPQPIDQPTFPTPTRPSPGVDVPGMLPYEQSYIENILRLNAGKIATIYMTFENNSEWNAKIFKGKVEAAGRDHIIISDPATGKRYLLLMINLDYITFDEELNYDFDFPGR